jgi:hypothetical protein
MNKILSDSLSFSVAIIGFLVAIIGFSVAIIDGLYNTSYRIISWVIKCRHHGINWSGIYPL